MTARHHYRFRIQRLLAGTGHLFQLRVGMEGERDFEFVPIHRTAFAERLDLEPAYAHEVDAHLQLSAVLKWIDERMANGLTAH